MTASNRFKPVLKIAENREANAARRFGLSKKQQQEEEEKLENLRQYHVEYMKRFQQSAITGISAGRLREYQTFLNKLEQAIGQQEETVKQSKINCNEHKQVWTEKHIRTRSMDKAMDRIVKNEQKSKASAEQKLSDEIGQLLRRPR